MKQLNKTIFFFLCVTAFAFRSHAQIKIYMKLIDGNGNMINGESQSTAYKNFVEISAVAYKDSLPISATSGAGSGVGRVYIGNITLQMALNAASLNLMGIMANGTVLKSVDLYYVKGSACCPFYRVHLETVNVANFSESASMEDVQEQVTFAASQVAYGYYIQALDGSFPSKPTSYFGWDIKLNKTYTYPF